MSQQMARPATTFNMPPDDVQSLMSRMRTRAKGTGGFGQPSNLRAASIRKIDKPVELTLTTEQRAQIFNSRPKHLPPAHSIPAPAEKEPAPELPVVPVNEPKENSQLQAPSRNESATTEKIEPAEEKSLPPIEQTITAEEEESSEEPLKIPEMPTLLSNPDVKEEITGKRPADIQMKPKRAKKRGRHSMPINNACQSPSNFTDRVNKSLRSLQDGSEEFSNTIACKAIKFIQDSIEGEGDDPPSLEDISKMKGTDLVYKRITRKMESLRRQYDFEQAAMLYRTHKRQSQNFRDPLLTEN